jgi:hypothetical protein
MKAIRCLIAGIIFSTLPSNGGAADHQKGIKMLIDAASRHHRSPGAASAIDPDDKQRGIKTLIEAATASRHPRPLSGPGPHAAKDTGRGDGDRDAANNADGDDHMDRTLRDLSSGAVAPRESAAPKAAPGPGPAAASGARGASVSIVNAGAGADATSGSAASKPGPSPTAMNGAATGAGAAPASGAHSGAVTLGARTPAVAVGLSNARRNKIASRDLSAVTGVPSLSGRGTLNATRMGRPPPAIGGAAITTNAGRLNGTVVRSKH